MAVARLSGAWILDVLRTNYPGGVLRRALLDQFAAELVTPRSSRGAKGRIARKLYTKLGMLQRKGAISFEEGVIRPLVVGKKAPRDKDLPLLGPLLKKKLFLVLMAEDRPEGQDAASIRRTRWDFLAAAIEAGWTMDQAAEAIGLTRAKADGIVAKPKG